MRIAYYTSNRTLFPPSANDIAASSDITYEIVSRLKEKHEITVYAAKGSVVPGVKIVDCDLPPISIDSANQNQDWITKSVLGLKSIPLGKLFEDADQFDIIHIQTEPIYLAMPYASLIKTPILFTAHHPCYEFEHPIYNFYDHKIHFSALSKAHAANFPFTQDIPVVYNGLDISNFQVNHQDDGYFLFLGRLVPEKGILDFLSLVEANPQSKFIIAGSGPLEDKVRAFCVDHPNAKFHGPVQKKSADWYSLFAKAKAFIMPINCDESFGLTMIEAMASGTPVIAYDRGAAREIVDDNQNGFIVPRNDIKSLSSAVDRLNDLSSTDYHSFRELARQKVENNFTCDVMAAGYEALYQKIISQN